MANRKSLLSGTYTPSDVARAAYIAASNGLPLGNGGAASSSPKSAVSDRRYSVAALWSMAAENDVEVDDELTKGEERGQPCRMLLSHIT
jgi:Ras GTPase-activating-like protein IQGAP2/3